MQRKIRYVEFVDKRKLKYDGYDGDFSYESGSRRIPEEGREARLKYTVELGRNLMAIE